MISPADLARARQGLLTREQALMRKLLSLYHTARAAVLPPLRRLLSDLADAARRGLTIGRDRLTGQPAYRALVAAIGSAFERFGQAAAWLVNQSHAAALLAGVADAAAMIGTTTKVSVMSRLGLARNGRPIGALFADFGPATTHAVIQELTTGLASRANAARLLQRVDVALGKTAVKAMSIARNETMAAYRAATLEQFRASGGRVVGWVWHAGGDNPCAFCRSMDGTEHDLGEAMSSHSNCRCAQTPLFAAVAVREVA